MEPLIVAAGRGDILENQVQQCQQRGADGDLIFNGKRQAVAEVAQHEFAGRYRRKLFSQEGTQLHCHVVQAGVVFAQRWLRLSIRRARFSASAPGRWVQTTLAGSTAVLPAAGASPAA